VAQGLDSGVGASVSFSKIKNQKQSKIKFFAS
jgi:hypothetical protein